MLYAHQNGRGSFKMISNSSDTKAPRAHYRPAWAMHLKDAKKATWAHQTQKHAKVHGAYIRNFPVAQTKKSPLDQSWHSNLHVCSSPPTFHHRSDSHSRSPMHLKPNGPAWTPKVRPANSPLGVPGAPKKNCLTAMGFTSCKYLENQQLRCYPGTLSKN